MKNLASIILVAFVAIGTCHGVQGSPPTGRTTVPLDPLREFLEYDQDSHDTLEASLPDLDVRFDPESLSESDARYFAIEALKTQRQEVALGRFEVFATPVDWDDKMVAVKSVRQNFERLFFFRRQKPAGRMVVSHVVDDLPGFPTTTGVQFLRNNGKTSACLFVINQWGQTQVGVVDEGAGGAALDDVYHSSIVEQGGRRRIVAIAILEILSSTDCPLPDPTNTLETVLTNCFLVKAAVATYGVDGAEYSRSHEVVFRMHRGYSLLAGGDRIVREYEDATMAKEFAP